MATTRQVTIREVFDQRLPHREEYKGNVQDATILFAKGEIDGKEKNIAVMVFSERIADEIRAGETYTGYYVPPITLQEKEYFPFKITAADNPSLQLEGSDYGGGGSPRRSGGSSGGGKGHDGVGQSIGNAITNATNVAIAEMDAGTSGQIDVGRLCEVASSIFAFSRSLNEGTSAPAESGEVQADDAENEAKLKELVADMDKAGDPDEDNLPF